MKYSIRLFGIMLSVGFLAACNGVSTLNCNPDAVKFQEAAENGDTYQMRKLWEDSGISCDEACGEHDSASVRADQRKARNLLQKMRKHEGGYKNRDTAGDRRFFHEKCLMDAATNGDEDTVRELLDIGVYMYYMDRDMHRPFSRAVKNNHIGVVKLMLRKGVYANTRDKSGYTSLMWAKLLKHTEIIKLLEEYNDKRSQLPPTRTSFYMPAADDVSEADVTAPVTNNVTPDDDRQTEDNTTPSTGGHERAADHDVHRQNVNVTVPVTNNNQQTVHVTAPSANDDRRPDNNFNATVSPNITVNPIFHAPQAEEADDEVECCASFLKCLKCVIPFLAL